MASRTSAGPKGLGGLLILPMVWNALTPLVLLATLVLVVLAMLGVSLPPVTGWMGTGQWLWVAVACVGLLAVSVACASSFFLKRRPAPDLQVAWLAVGMVVKPLVLIGIGVYLDLSVMWWLVLLAGVVVAEVVLGAWVRYFQVSQRVANTFGGNASSVTLAIARRELVAYFVSEIGYLVAALFVGGAGAYFSLVILKPGAESTLRPLFELMAWGMIVAAPLLTMRLLAEEFRSGTVETLMTAPVTDTQVVLGKFLGAMGFYLALLAMTLPLLAIVSFLGRPDAGVAAMGYLGLVLLGAAYLSTGLLASTLTRHQFLAVVVSLVILLVMGYLLQLAVQWAPAPWDRLAQQFYAMDYFRDFARGVFDSRALVYFGTWTAGALFLSVKILESRRWR